MASLHRAKPLILAVGGLGACLLLGGVRSAPSVTCSVDPPPPLAVRSDPLRDVRALPAGIDAVVVVSRAARQRRSEAGVALSGLLRESGLASQTALAWEDLAGVLGLSPTDAFDTLLGRRVTLVIDGLGSGERLEWAVLSHVGVATEERLRERLNPAPRGIVDGQVVLAVEGGRYELATARRRSEDGTEEAAVLLAPSHCAALFDSLLPIVSGRVREGGLARSEAFVRAEGLGAGDVFVLARFPEAVPANAEGRPEEDLDPAQEPPRNGDVPDDSKYLLLSAVQRQAGWASRMVTSPGLIWSPGSGWEGSAPWSDAAFREVERGALAAVVELVTDPGAPSRAPAGVMTASASLVLGVVEEAREQIGRRWAVVLHRDGPGGEPGKGASSFSMTAGVEATEIRGMAKVGDGLLARLLGWVRDHGGPSATGNGAEAAPAGPDFAGLYPGAVRMEPLGTALAGRPQPAFGASPVLSWYYPSAVEETAPPHEPASGPVDAPVARADGAPSTGGGVPGWWVMNVSAGSVDERERGAGIRRIGAALLAPENPGTMRRRVSIGSVHPAAIESAIGAMGLAEHEPLRFMRWIEAVEWDAWAGGMGEQATIDGIVEVRMRGGAGGEGEGQEEKW